MKSILWRVIVASIAVFIFWLVAPLFFAAIGLKLSGDMQALIHVVVPCLALLYVFFGPEPTW